MGQEKNYETRIKAWLQSQGIYSLGTPKQKMKVPPIGYYEKRFANKMTGAGLPDMHIVVNGTSIEAELKAPKGFPSELQKHIVEQINRSGCIGYVVYESKLPHDDWPYYINYEALKGIICKYLIQE